MKTFSWVKHAKKINYAVLSMVCATCFSKAIASDEQFSAALSASNSGNVEMLNQYTASMQGNVLGYYPEYWSLNKNLSFQPPSVIVNFAQKYPQSAMAEKLASDYVEEKVKQGNFTDAQSVISYVTNPDQAEKCAIAQVRIKNGDTLAFAEYQDMWLATQNMPDFCLGLGRMMLSSPLVNEQDRQQRLWAQLRAGQSGPAMATAETLGMNLSLAQLNQIQSNPLQYLWSAPKQTPIDHAYLIYAIGRMSENDLNTGIESVPKAIDSVPDAVKQYIYRTVAYMGGTTVLKNNFNKTILNYFDYSYGLPFSPEEAEIYARQAIRFGSWESVIRAISSMNETQQHEDRWQYWLARAYEQRADATSNAQSIEIYQNLAKAGDDYHNLLAQQHLGQKFTKFNQEQPTTADTAKLSQDINFSRAFVLRTLNAPAVYTNREWNWAVRQAYLKQDDGLLLAAAQKASQLGWYDRAIYAAERTQKRHNDTIRYLTPHQSAVTTHSANVTLDPAWAYGLMRQESRFVTTARSHVGAGGLMQIMPNTAKLVAKQMGESYNPAALTDMNTNVRYGTYYLSMIQSQLSGNAVLATAGYNAGPNRARRWQPTDLDLPADQYVESIPLNETRDYVKNVMTNATHYGVVLGQGLQDIGKWMKTIPTRAEQ